MTSRYSVIGIVLCCLMSLTNANYKEVGDNCIIPKTGKSGICKSLFECTEARNDFIFKQVRPTVCNRLSQIVCCPTKVEIPYNGEPDNLPIAVRKCKEYSKYAYTNITIPVNDGVIIKSTDHCGYLVVPSIVGGSPAMIREFPHSALLGYEQPDHQIIWKCGGSLVSTRYVLTAAHCLTTEPLGKVSHVRLGVLVITISDTDKTNVIEVTIEKEIKHPGYRGSRKYNDIALLKLARKIELSPHIRPICLPTENLHPKKLLATGWGAIKYFSDISDVLLKVELESYSNNECNVFFGNVEDRKLPDGIIETQLCAGWKNTNETRDTCQGDSGGPLQIYNSDPHIHCMYTQVAITSFGIGCNSTHLPGVYTRLYNYLPWIENEIWASGEDD